MSNPRGVPTEAPKAHVTLSRRPKKHLGFRRSAFASVTFGPILLSTLAVVFTAVALLSAACSSSAARAKRELGRKGLEFTESAFLGQVRAGDLDTVRLYLSAGMSADAAEGGYTALLEAARRGFEPIALELIEAGADIRAKGPYDVTALMFSCITGSGETALRLIGAGADINAKDADGRTALIEALTTENDIPPDLIRTLIEKGADVNARIAGGITPLMIAVYDDPEIVRMIVAAGADVNARDDNGASVLRMAADNPENAEILKNAGAVER